MDAVPAVVPSEAQAWRAALFLLAFPRRYIALAPAHYLAVNLKAADLRAAYARGSWPPAGWEAQAKEVAADRAAALRSGLWRALITTTLFVLAGVAVAFVVGTVHPALPWSASKVLSVVGGGLAAWATLFELGGFTETWGGNSLLEIARPVIFRVIFLPGISIAALGQLL